jgi:hypothetical protein
MVEGKDQWMAMCQLKRANDVRELFVARAGLLQKRAHGYWDNGRSVDVGGKGEGLKMVVERVWLSITTESTTKGLPFQGNNNGCEWWCIRYGYGYGGDGI